MLKKIHLKSDPILVLTTRPLPFITLIFLSSLLPSFVEADKKQKAGAGVVVIGSALAIIGVVVRKEKTYFLTEDYIYQDLYSEGRFGEELPHEPDNIGTSNSLIVGGILIAMIGVVVAITGNEEEHSNKTSPQWHDRLEIDPAQGARLAYRW